MIAWLDNPAPSWLITLKDLFGSVWAPILAAAVTYFTVKRSRDDEHARWKRDELVKIGMDFSTLSKQWWEVLYFQKIIFDGECSTDDFKHAKSNLDRLPRSQDAVGDLFLLAFRADLISEETLSRMISDFTGFGLFKDSKSTSPSQRSEALIEVRSRQDAIIAEIARLIRL